MAAKVEAMNDTSAVKSLADEIASAGSELKDLGTQLAKLGADMKKSPDECKKPAETAMSILVGIKKAGSDYEDLSKRIGKSVAK